MSVEDLIQPLNLARVNAAPPYGLPADLGTTTGPAFAPPAARSARPGRFSPRDRSPAQQHGFAFQHHMDDNQASECSAMHGGDRPVRHAGAGGETFDVMDQDRPFGHQTRSNRPRSARSRPVRLGIGLLWILGTAATPAMAQTPEAAVSRGVPLRRARLSQHSPGPQSGHPRSRTHRQWQ